MKVRCERDGTEFHVNPRSYTYRREYAEQDGLAYPVRVIDCPTCGRGYFQDADKKWRSDRELTILEDEEELEL